MYIMVVGLNYRSAPVEIRERFALPESELEVALAKLRRSGAIHEVVLVSTCNRTEIYAVAEDRAAGEEAIYGYLTDLSGVPRATFLPHLYVYGENQAIRHLFRVTAGLDSMVLGETQILGQVRTAFLFSQEIGATAAVFNGLFKRSVTVAKRAHNETKIGENAVSVSYAAVELAKKIFESLDNKTVLIIGAGKMSELTAKHLNANGATQVLVVNRTYQRAKELADKFDGKALDMNSLEMALKEADIVVSSTGAEGYVVTKEHVKATMKTRRHRPLFLIDIAVPRDLDPEMCKVDNVFLYDIDDLEGVIAINMKERQKEADKIEIIIAEEMSAFRQWQNEQQAKPLILKLRENAMAQQAQLMQNLVNKVSGLSEKDVHTINKLTMTLINQMVHGPITQVKEMATEKEADMYLSVFSRIFGLDGGEESASDKPVAEKSSGSVQEAAVNVQAIGLSSHTSAKVAVTKQLDQTRQEEAPAAARMSSIRGRWGTR
ncbi:glutamyl-tRNA reductase [Tumebacillus permanentifrigoris]|uniref:Glutamyl-tRNA reductase n=1 Tax=Tumebacillus permanentifrigoris TaxID=378543 RepID=A0A316DCF3_9BACL|nr:glutamyl-tRNA reductase [Tumebacillus permanentifrigoris]PWK15827.1 glutamyl-tRNA reductase [Tumebacillus permanentifrigoris]